MKRQKEQRSEELRQKFIKKMKKIKKEKSIRVDDFRKQYKFFSCLSMNIKRGVHR